MRADESTVVLGDGRRLVHPSLRTGASAGSLQRPPARRFDVREWVYGYAERFRTRGFSRPRAAANSGSDDSSTSVAARPAARRSNGPAILGAVGLVILSVGVTMLTVRPRAGGSAGKATPPGADVPGAVPVGTLPIIGRSANGTVGGPVGGPVGGSGANAPGSGVPTGAPSIDGQVGGQTEGGPVRGQTVGGPASLIVGSGGATGGVGTRPLGDPTPAVTIAVHAAGEVRLPAVYVVSVGARVDDVLRAAGGVTERADTDAINLAARVADGERVYVPAKGQPVPAILTGTGSAGSAENVGLQSGPGASTGSSASPGGVVDLNTASVEQLDSLPGVGPATAQKIVDHRTKIGRFKTISQLMDVPGIGESKYAALKSRIRV